MGMDDGVDVGEWVLRGEGRSRGFVLFCTVKML